MIDEVDLLQSMLPDDWQVVREASRRDWIQVGYRRIWLLSPVGVRMCVIVQSGCESATLESGRVSRKIYLTSTINPARDVILAMHLDAVADAGIITATVRSRADD